MKSLLLFFFALAAYGQTILKTTLNYTVEAADTQIQLASVTGQLPGNLIYIDREAIKINSITGTALAVQRGVNGTRATGHILNSVAYAGAPSLFIQEDRSGTCAVSPGVPYINILNGLFWYCDYSATIGRWLSPNKVQNYSFAFLPTPGNANRFVTVSDCLTSACTAGGGSTVATLRDDGTQWVTISGSGGGGSSSTGLTATATSATILSITAGSCQIGNVQNVKVASTGTLSGSSASSTIYVYCDSTGALILGHNGAATLTCSAGCTVATGITTWPVNSLPIATSVYTSNVLATPTSLIPTTRGDLFVSGDGISITPDGAGVKTIAVTSAPVSLKSYLPFGALPENAGASSTAFAANETRWLLVTFQSAVTFTKLGIFAEVGIGGGAGIKAAVADTSGVILNTSATQTTCNTGNICVMTFAAASAIGPGQYYIGITTDSTAFRTRQARWPYLTMADALQTVTGGSTTTMGTGTAGAGTGASVAFGASMGALTKWSGAAEALGKFWDPFLDN